MGQHGAECYVIELTVIIPCHNRHQKLKRSIKSVLQQNITCNFELIIVDDGSTPPIELPQEFDEGGKIKIIRHSQKRGAAAARNTGARFAKGLYFAFLDSDDFWLESKINSQLTEIKLHSDRLIVVGTGWYKTLPETDVRIAVLPKPSNRENDFYSGCWFAPGSTALLHRKTFFRVGYYDQQLSRLEDYDWFCRFASLGGSLVVLNIHAVVIERGQMPDVEKINTSISRLVKKAVKLRHVRKMVLSLSYLWMEKSASYYKNGFYYRAIKWAFLSWLLVPRVSIQIKKCWKLG